MEHVHGTKTDTDYRKLTRSGNKNAESDGQSMRSGLSGATMVEADGKEKQHGKGGLLGKVKDHWKHNWEHGRSQS